jgi:parallel beta-helix repeat protein
VDREIEENVAAGIGFKPSGGSDGNGEEESIMTGLTRRTFLKTSSAAAGAMGIGSGLIGSGLSAWGSATGVNSATTSTMYYVATNGNDAWSGKLAEPNAPRTDGPFATLYRARDAVRELKNKQAPAESVTVIVRGGKYFLDQTLTFGEEDSGSREFPIRYQGCAGEKVVLSGGKRVTGWKPYRGQILQAELPGSKGGKWKFRQLFLNGESQIRSRYPKYDRHNPLYGGWLFAAGGKRKGSTPSFNYKPGSFPRRWAKPQNGELIIFQERGWSDSTVAIKSIDEATHTITASQEFRSVDFPPWFQAFDNFDGSGDRFRVENLLEELTEPGEWCLDPDEGILYFWPPNGNLKPADELVAPALSTLIDIENAAWLAISGFVFTETLGGDETHRTDLDGYGAMFTSQGRKYCGEAMHLQGAEHCVIEHNRFYAVGGNAIYLERYNARNVIRRNEISHAGTNGICLLGNYIPIGAVSEPMAKGRQPFPMFNEVTDNHIHHCGTITKFTDGIILGVSDSNLIAHNRLEYLPGHAINLGLNGFGRNLVEYNEIHHVCLETWDEAAINVWMTNPLSDAMAGHVIRFNLMTDVIGCHTERDGSIMAPDGAANGIYLDQSTSNCFVQGNIIVRPSGYGFMVHGGQHNLIENNIVVDATSNATVWVLPISKKVEYTGFSGQVGYFGDLRSAFLFGNRFCNNIIYYKQGRYTKPTTLFDLRPRGDDSQSKGNTRYVISESNRNVFFRHDNGECIVTEITQQETQSQVRDVLKSFSVAEWQEKGFDLNSVQADPLFLDPDRDDYRLKPESPALRLGFVPTDIAKIGIRAEHDATP